MKELHPDVVAANKKRAADEETLQKRLATKVAADSKKYDDAVSAPKKTEKPKEEGGKPPEGKSKNADDGDSK